MTGSRFLSILLLLTLCGYPAPSRGQDAYLLRELDEKKEQSAIHLVLEFVPVTTMDEVGNREMSLTMAFFHAEDALSKHFKKNKGVSFSPKMYNVLKLDDHVCRIEFTIPNRAIVDAVRTETNSVASVIKREKTPDRTDATLKDFRSSCFRDLRIAEAFYYDAIRKCKDTRKLDPDIRKAFDALLKKIENDDSLFISEKTDLKNKAEKIRSFLLERLDTGDEGGDGVPASRRQNLKLVSKFVVLREYEKLLLDNPIVLTTSGCWILKDNGKIYLVAVGSARAADETPRAKLRKSKIAETELMGEIAKFRDTHTVTASEISKTRTTMTNGRRSTTSSKRDFSSYTNAFSESHIGDMETIGQWYSADGTVFFLAKGRLLSER